MGTKEQAEQLVESIDRALGELTSLMSDPAEVAFDDVRDAFVRLEETVAKKTFLDAAFAWVSERSDAGRHVGSTRPVDFLIKKLQLSRQEAYGRMGRGEDLFSPPVATALPTPSRQPDESEAQRLHREQLLRQEEHRRAEKDKQAQLQARKQALKHVSTEKHQTIRTGLAGLNEHSNPSYAALHARALVEAQSRAPEDLRVWLRAQITKANVAGRQADGTRDRLAGQKKRFLHIGQADEDGNVRISGSLPAYLSAKLKAALAPGLRAGVNASVPEDQDKRSRSVRAADQLNVLLDGHLAADAARNRQGVGSVVVSMTVQDVETMSADSKFIANSGDLLSPFDLMALGAAKFDIATLHDSAGKPLALGRSLRSASMYQKLALFAREALCTCGNCDAAMINTEVHHLTSWGAGGLTDIENLTLLCPPHHGDNNDKHDGQGGMGHMATDPATGRVGWSPPGGGAIEANNTQLHEYSAGAKIRARQREHSPTPAGHPPDPPTLLDRAS
ncbi:HNH endonuclease signature motif containing protein [Corynebacterium alimapuense]|uniref:HNH endonuclease n=1 Tax=Corynebacterium alimapuense TaxID=1576874 RepID=A0A3M8K910_9CORY|nr:HNH endonuclease signature motif containing protein [Corynebacterium alimapuense]RNE49369.1 HNH endonuclease [Corynebacterium alimapuense]